MKQETAKRFGAAAGAVMLASSALAGVGTAVAAEAPEGVAPGVSQDAAAEQASQATGVSQANVSGDFAFSQDVVSSNATISGVFAKAANALCASMPDYAVRCACGNVVVVTGDGVSVQANVGELAEVEDAGGFIMGCSCATNVPGGGATVNAEVQGVALATLMGLVS